MQGYRGISAALIRAIELLPIRRGGWYTNLWSTKLCTSAFLYSYDIKFKKKVPPYCRMALGVLELSYKKLAFQECERGLGGQGVVDLGLLGLDIGLEGGLDVGS